MGESKKEGRQKKRIEREDRWNEKRKKVEKNRKRRKWEQKLLENRDEGLNRILTNETSRT